MRDNFLPDLAEEIRRNLAEHFADKDMAVAQVLGVAEEAGEFVGAYRRYAGMARRSADFREVAEELADVIIMSYTAAEYLGIDLHAETRAKATKIRTRGWKDPR